MKRYNPPCVVSIAGTDPSGGAGIQADIKAISATGSYAASIVTALVAQNTTGVQSIHEIPPSFVTEQMNSVFSDLTVAAVKIGMLHDEAIIEAVASALDKLTIPHVVFDPVMVAKNGCALLKPHTIDYLKSRLLPLATLITPNIPEAEQLIGSSIHSTADMAAAAVSLSKQFGIDVLVKGGHQQGNQCSDVLCHHKTHALSWFHSPRINTKNTHGTGCTLSAAIASFLAQDYPLNQAIAAAKNYLSKAIEAGSHLSIGHGHGPVDHFYFLDYGSKA